MSGSAFADTASGRHRHRSYREGPDAVGIGGWSHRGNFGPGDPCSAHAREEHVLVPRIAGCEAALRARLTRPR